MSNVSNRNCLSCYENAPIPFRSRKPHEQYASQFYQRTSSSMARMQAAEDHTLTVGPFVVSVPAAVVPVVGVRADVAPAVAAPVDAAVVPAGRVVASHPAVVLLVAVVPADAAPAVAAPTGPAAAVVPSVPVVAAIVVRVEVASDVLVVVPVAIREVHHQARAFGMCCSRAPLNQPSRPSCCIVDIASSTTPLHLFPPNSHCMSYHQSCRDVCCEDRTWSRAEQA